ncbi:MAG: VOC family protein [Pseudomonadota bacterium]
MPRIDTIVLRSADPEAQRDFYRETLGMRDRDDGTIGYAECEAGLLFEAGDGPYEPTPKDLYWKIALSVPNIDLACRQLADKGVEVGTPRQVGDIAYLAHFGDPAGFTIELIDHWFEGERPPQEHDTRRLGGGAHLSLLTLRSHDVEQADRTATALGMAPLSVVPAPDLGFTLYFYGFAAEPPPNPDLYAVENRTWVYRLPETVLEVVHRPQQEPMAQPGEGAAGYGGATVSGAGRVFDDEYLSIRCVGKP